MKFKQGARRKAIEYEKDLVQYWKDNKIFEKSIGIRPKENSYVFYDGPPFITGEPHHGTLLSSVVKDAVPRYWTMKGKRVERRWGWDTHGLPAENFVEKKLGITDRHDIGTKISLADYITTARESMIQTGNLWEDTIDRIGRWVDFKGAYTTMDKNYMESVWWAFKQLYEKGKIYEGERVLMYDTKWATPLSKAEVTMDAGAYQVVTDPSVYVKFRLFDDEYTSYMFEAHEDVDFTPDMPEAERKAIDQRIEDKSPKTYLLAWTTTPWTLPGNTAVAINKDLTYAKVDYKGERLIVAKNAVERVFTDEKHQPLDYKVIDEIRGEALRDYGYEPLFEDRGQEAHFVWHAPYVTDTDGSGIVHLAPAYGEEDFDLAKAHNIPIVHVLDDYGVYTEGDWKGEDVWEINKTIAKTLLERGAVWKIDYIQHEYPHNLRNGNRLMYRAHPSWFIDIDGQRTEMLEQNTNNINWFPGHIKHGRFENTVKTAPDWNLSRDRFWATAMPVWKGNDKDGKEHIKVIGSYSELKELSGVELDDYHRPWVDHITFTIDEVKYTRVDKVLDCWFESGSMPFAQFHYPFENVEEFEQNFPGDFIVEYVGQVRAWFYYMHAVSVGLFGKNAYTNVITTGTLAGNDGRKMSKSFGNYTDPNILMDQFSADALRFLLLSSPVLNGEDFSLTDKDVGDTNRKLAMIWNMYDFFTMYADVDGWEWDGKLEDPTEVLTNPLDLWVVSRVHQLTEHVDKHMQSYNIPIATADILPFIDDASNWYVRRSRKRFWKSDNDTDKNDAYKTLHYVLVRLSIVLAPFTPFLAEELYQKLTGGESVHLLDWPQEGHIDPEATQQMALLRHIINIGLSLRAEKGIKVRQPLAAATIKSLYKNFSKEMLEIIQEELNLKIVSVDDNKLQSDKSFLENLKQGNFSQIYQIEIDFNITPPLKREGLSREVIRQVQNARKQAGLMVDDRIDLVLSTGGDELQQAVNEHQEVIMQETLAQALTADGSGDYETTVKIENQELVIKLSISA